VEELACAEAGFSRLYVGEPCLRDGGWMRLVVGNRMMREDGRSAYIEPLSSECEKFSLGTAVFLLSITISTSIHAQQRPESPSKYLIGTYGHSVV
jgi:hypothetical protein